MTNLSSLLSHILPWCIWCVEACQPCYFTTQTSVPLSTCDVLANVCGASIYITPLLTRMSRPACFHGITQWRVTTAGIIKLTTAAGWHLAREPNSKQGSKLLHNASMLEDQYYFAIRQCGTQVYVLHNHWVLSSVRDKETVNNTQASD